MFQDYDQKFARKSLFLEELHLCSILMNKASSKSQLCQLSYVQRGIKKTLLKVPFTSPAGQNLIKYSKVKITNNCASRNSRTLRSDAENILIFAGPKFNDKEPLENRFYSFSRHPLSNNNIQTTYLALNAGKMSRGNDASEGIQRLMDAKESKLLTFINENRGSRDNSHLTVLANNAEQLKLCKKVSVKLQRLTDTKIATIHRRRKATKPLKQINQSFLSIEATSRRPLKDYTINAKKIKQCSRVTVDIGKLKSDAVKVHQLPLNVCKSVTLNLTPIVRKHYVPNSWLRAYYK